MANPTIEEVKEKLDIVEVVRKKVPDLKQSGRNYKGLCPFHSEKTPSFMVNPDLGIFKCFGCGEGGDVISFIQKTERLDFREALRFAAETAGLKIEDPNFKLDPEKERQKKRLKEVNTLATQYYTYLLLKHEAGKTAKEYLKKRGIDKITAEKYDLGYAPGGKSLVRFLKSKGFSEKELIEYGHAVERKGTVYDKFRQRLMFPIFNLRGDVIGFSGRTLIKDGIPKFLNSPETSLYKKSESMYGFYHAKDEVRKQGFVILFEGNVDVLNSSRLGIENIACPLGTAITKDQLKICKRYADTVYFCFDTDEAGYKALLRGVGLAEEIGLKHKVVNIGKYLDADELMMDKPDLWPRAVGAASNSIEYILSVLSRKYDLSDADSKIRFRDEAIDVLKLIYDEVELSHFVSRLSDILGVTKDIITAMLKGGSRTPRIMSEVRKEELKNNEPQDRISVSKREIVLLALLSQMSKNEFIDRVSPEVFTSEYTREIFDKFAKYKDSDLDIGSIATEVDKESLPLLEKIIMFDLPNSQDFEDELLKVYRQMYLGRLRRQIKDLGKHLVKFPEDQDSVKQLNFLTRELHSLVSNKKQWPDILNKKNEE